MEMWEREAFELYYKSRRKKEKADALYFFMQKLCGVILLGIVALVALMTNDATIGVILVPLGLFLIGTRHKVMDFDFMYR
jgi:hypothetical protein